MMKELKRLVLELSNKCNLRCRICTDKPLTGPMLTLAAFRKLIGKVAHPQTIERLRFVGSGETLIVPDFHKMITEAARLFENADMEFFTNGMFLKRELVESIIEKNVKAHVVLSIDGTTSEIFDYIRRGASIHRVLMNIEHANSLKAINDSIYPELKINFTMIKQNIEEIPKMVRLASEIGVEEITFSQLVLNSSGELAKPENHPFHGQNLPRTKDALLEARELSREYGIDLTITWPQVFGWTERYSKASDLSGKMGVPLTFDPCIWVLEALSINLEGEGYPCCRYGISFGNIHEHDSLDEVFNSPEATRLRDRLLNMRDVPECHHCLWYQRFSFTYGGESYWVSEAMFGGTIAVN
jgi:MoaA/NifB/PqqE/SkfB family radical SAM enzyme